MFWPHSLFYSPTHRPVLRMLAFFQSDVQGAPGVRRGVRRGQDAERRRRVADLHRGEVWLVLCTRRNRPKGQHDEEQRTGACTM